jgi:putative oxidoreductase
MMAIGAIAVELGAGLLLLVGYKARWAALAIFLFLIPATLIFHNFWASPPAEFRMQQINFMKNFAIMGGMLMVWAFGPGRFAFDRDTV